MKLFADTTFVRPIVESMDLIGFKKGTALDLLNDRISSLIKTKFHDKHGHMHMTDQDIEAEFHKLQKDPNGVHLFRELNELSSVVSTNMVKMQSALNEIGKRISQITPIVHDKKDEVLCQEGFSSLARMDTSDKLFQTFSWDTTDVLGNRQSMIDHLHAKINSTVRDASPQYIGVIYGNLFSEGLINLHLTDERYEDLCASMKVIGGDRIEDDQMLSLIKMATTGRFDSTFGKLLTLEAVDLFGNEAIELRECINTYYPTLTTMLKAYDQLELSAEKQDQYFENLVKLQDMFLLFGYELVLCQNKLSSCFVFEDGLHLNEDNLNTFHRNGGTYHDIARHMHMLHTVPKTSIPRRGVTLESINNNRERLVAQTNQHNQRINKDAQSILAQSTWKALRSVLLAELDQMHLPVNDIKRDNAMSFIDNSLRGLHLKDVSVEDALYDYYIYRDYNDTALKYYHRALKQKLIQLADETDGELPEEEIDQIKAEVTTDLLTNYFISTFGEKPKEDEVENTEVPGEDIGWTEVADNARGDMLFGKVTQMCKVTPPDDYVELATEFNGGVPDKPYFYCDDWCIKIDKLLRVDEKSEDNIFDMWNAMQSDEQGKNLFPFAMDDKKNLLCFRSSGKQDHAGDPEIVMFVRNDDVAADKKVIFVCASFGFLIEHLLATKKEKVTTESMGLSILERVIGVLKYFTDKTATATSTIESLDLDSLDRVEVALALEEEFGIDINDSKDQDWIALISDKKHTVQHLVKYIEKKMKK